MPLDNFVNITSSTSVSGAEDLYFISIPSSGGANTTITLPDASINDGLRVRFLRIDNTAFTATITGFSGSQLINGAASVNIFQYNDITMETINSNWVAKLPEGTEWRYASGSPVTLVTLISGLASTGAVVGVDNSASSISLASTNIDLSGGSGQNINMAQQAGKNGVLTNLSVIFSGITSLSLVAATATVKVQLYSAASNSNTFAPISAAVVNLSLPSSVVLGTIVTAEATGLTVPITKGTQYLLVASLSTTGLAIATTNSSYIRAAASITYTNG